MLEWNQPQYLFCKNGSKSVIENNNNRQGRLSFQWMVQLAVVLVFVVISVDSVDVTLAPLRQSHNQHLPTTTYTSTKKFLLGGGETPFRTGNGFAFFIGVACWEEMRLVVCCCLLFESLFLCLLFLLAFQAVARHPRSLCYFNNN